jgi:glycosyltransferase involved in cell wall biosynthesis
MRIEFRESSVQIGCSKGESFHVDRNWNDVMSRDNPLRLLYIAAITGTRRLHILLDALDMMSEEKRERFRLTVVGGPPVEKWQAYYDGLLSRVNSGRLASIVEFKGQRPYSELPEICARHDVFVFTSARPEGTPNAVLEAMMSGLCVVTTGAGGSAEIAEAADQPRFTVDNPGELKEVLLDLERNRSKVVEIAENGRRIVREEFSFDVMVDSFERVIGQLAAKRGRQAQGYLPLAAHMQEVR